MRNIKLVCFLLMLILGAAFANVMEVEAEEDEVATTPANNSTGGGSGGNTVTTLPPATTVQFISKCTQACANGGACVESLARCACPAAWSGVTCTLANTAIAYTATSVVSTSNGQSVGVQVATDGTTFSQPGATMSTVAHTAADLATIVTPAALAALNLTLAPQGLSVVFELNAVDSSSNPIHIVDRPVPVTVTGPYVNGNTRLYVMLDGAIADAAATCPTQVRTYNAATSTLTTNVCHFTMFFTAQSQDGLNIPQTGSAVLDPKCTSNGEYLSSQGNCVCLSGHSGQFCADAIVESAGCNYTSTQIVHEGLYPHLNLDTSLRGFTGNNLFFSVDGPFVSNRMFASLTFRDSTDQRCNIGAFNSFWTQAPVGGAHCGDRFTITLPWTAHAGCGFGAPAQVAGYNQYKATAVLSYFDTLGKVVTFGNDILYRKTQVAFDIYVKFPAVLNVTIADIGVQSIYVNKTYFTQNTYDRDTGLLTIAYTTFANWPNYLSQERLAIVTPGATVVVYTPLAIDNSACTNTSGTTCRQVFTAQLNLAANGCDFTGVYTIQTTAVTCRDELYSSAAAQASTHCTKQAADFQFLITGQNVCGHVEAAPSVAAKLKFTLADYTTLAGVAEIGSTGYFKTDLIQSGGDNTITMKYLDITITDGASTRWLLQGGIPDPKWANSSYANLQVLDNQFAFNLNFATNVFFEVLPFREVQYTFWARAAIRYDGNTNPYSKREEMMVQYYWKPEVDKFAEGSVATMINFDKKSVAAAETPAVAPVAVAPTQELAVLGAAAVAGIAMIAGVIVVAVIRRRSAASSFRQLA